MHNLIANIAKFRQLLIEVYGADNLTNGNFKHYPNQPKATDIEIIALTLAAESQGIISENYLFQILNSDYKVIVKHYLTDLIIIGEKGHFSHLLMN